MRKSSAETRTLSIPLIFQKDGTGKSMAPLMLRASPPQSLETAAGVVGKAVVRPQKPLSLIHFGPSPSQHKDVVLGPARPLRLPREESATAFRGCGLIRALD